MVKSIRLWKVNRRTTSVLTEDGMEVCVVTGAGRTEALTSFVQSCLPMEFWELRAAAFEHARRIDRRGRLVTQN